MENQPNQPNQPENQHETIPETLLYTRKPFFVNVQHVYSVEPYTGLPNTKPFSPWVKYQGEIYHADFRNFMVGDGYVRIRNKNGVKFVLESEIQYQELPNLRSLNIIDIHKPVMSLNNQVLDTPTVRKLYSARRIGHCFDQSWSESLLAGVVAVAMINSEGNPYYSDIVSTLDLKGAFNVLDDFI